MFNVLYKVSTKILSMLEEADSTTLGKFLKEHNFFLVAIYYGLFTPISRRDVRKYINNHLAVAYYSALMTSNLIT